MEPRKLTKEDIDKIRHIEGFPIGKDEDIIGLSNAPYYTACPNPFIEEFINEYGKPYDEDTDEYHREPFAADVSEGKNDPLYMAHSYHTKVPYKAIMRYILHYTNPGDVVFDGFCGTGMTGVAAQMCGNSDAETKFKIEQELTGVRWGNRKAILNDLSTEAAFIASNYNLKANIQDFEKYAKLILQECESECSWMYRTKHVQHEQDRQVNFATDTYGDINYTVWSDLFLCSNCGEEINLWDVSVLDDGKVIDTPKCSNCHVDIDKNRCYRSEIMYKDEKTGEVKKIAKSKPIKMFYTYQGKRYSKEVDNNDIDVLNKISENQIDYWYPVDRMCDGSESRRNDKYGITNVNDFYTKPEL